MGFDGGQTVRSCVGDAWWGWRWGLGQEWLLAVGAVDDTVVRVRVPSQPGDESRPRVVWRVLLY